MTLTISSRNSCRCSNRSVNSNFLPTVFSASENFAENRSSSASWLEARSQPTPCATFNTSSAVLLTRTKNLTLMSARILSLQIRPSRPERSISIVLTDISINSALWITG